MDLMNQESPDLSAGASNFIDIGFNTQKFVDIYTFNKFIIYFKQVSIKVDLAKITINLLRWILPTVLITLKMDIYRLYSLCLRYKLMVFCNFCLNDCASR